MKTAHLSEVSWRSYIRAALAIARKDWLHFFRYPLNALFRVIEPIAWLTPFYFLGRSFASPSGSSGFADYTGTADFMSFILVGAVLSNYIGAVFWGMGYALKNEMDSGVLETKLDGAGRAPAVPGGADAGQPDDHDDQQHRHAGAGLAAVRLPDLWRPVSAVLVLLPMLIALYGFGFAFAAIVLLLKRC